MACVFFGCLSPRRAAALTLVAGWLLLPTARYPDNVAGVEFPFWIMPACLPANPYVTKALVIGLACLVGAGTFDPRTLSRFRPGWCDLPILGWCLLPLVSSPFQGTGPWAMAANSHYLFLAWGVPYLMGRFYFNDLEGLRELAIVVIAGGLLYVPLCVVEFLISPVFYKTLYGFHPFRWQGAERYVGHRPLVFLEDGNQLGIFMATTALIAVWLGRSGRLPRFGRLPACVPLVMLCATALLTQSVGAILLFLAMLGTLEILRRTRHIALLTLMLGGVLLLAYLGARATNAIDAKGLVQKTALGRQAIAVLRGFDRASLGWRLQVEERQTRVALERPWLGWGRWDWWRHGGHEERAWGLPTLALGLQGLLGWVLLLTVLWLPLGRLLWLWPVRLWMSPAWAAATALAAALTINALDAVLNGAFLLWLVAVAGGLVHIQGWDRPHRSYRIATQTS